ncbi:DUF6128 domain-containing protein [Blautia pseudococcoides]|uniref:DUF6128 domain-containing protein n=1 Tax=Blautia pseudococcoides TaxID=1796616 RepID=A0A1C7IGJ4_9FIRM|nr:DUF6128 domain-containing protein [Blautia pseudococcoides]ANU77282.1 hypothetical protein A4V09_16925 [Blautia pseudococcoides]ASU30077.1 hypothetical protein ADH70_015455 [Blautia pseudococcoides]QQQ94863.1 hypothetical protein I5Q86_09210 [Blautia pseudococcoides]
MAGYRRFVAYVYEYPDGKKGNGKGFIKVEARDGKCRMNYRITGIYGREEAPCKIYGFVRKEQGCEGIYLGECDLAGDTVQFQTEVPEQGLGGTAYGLNDLSGLIMLTGDGMMYGTGWDDKPVRLEEIRLPKMQKEPSRKADRASERAGSVRKEKTSGMHEEQVPEGVAASQALMEAEENLNGSSGYSGEEQDELPPEEEGYPSDGSMGERIYPPNANMDEPVSPLDQHMDEAAAPPEAGMDERVIPPNTGRGGQSMSPDTGMDKQIVPPNAGMDERIVPPNAGMDERIVPPNAGMDERIVPPNAGMDERIVPPNAGMDERILPPNAGMDERIVPPNAGMDERIVPPNAGMDERIVPPNAGMDERSDTSNPGTYEQGTHAGTGMDGRTILPNTDMEEPAAQPNAGMWERDTPRNAGMWERDTPGNAGRWGSNTSRNADWEEPAYPPNADRGGNNTSRNADWEEPAYPPNADRGGNNRSRNADWEEPAYPPNADRGGNNTSRNADWEEPEYPSKADRGNRTGTPGRRMNRPSQMGADPYMPARINERGAFIPSHYSEDEQPMPRQEEQTGREDAAVFSPETENAARSPEPPTGGRNAIETERNMDTTIPDTDMPPYTEEELYRETINNEIFGGDQYPNGGMRIEAADDEDAAEKTTWNPEGENEGDEINLLEELDQDEDAIRNMREMEKEVSKKKVQKPEAGELHEQSAQAARQPAVFAPFSDGEIVDCRQITPAELRILARRDRGLMNNNFLRHGYYRYHHLLLGRRRDDGRYILGVPGVYDRQECLMAGMFGFPNFKAAKTQGKASSPRFGYWYRLIDTPDINRRNRS